MQTCSAEMMDASGFGELPLVEDRERQTNGDEVALGAWRAVEFTQGCLIRLRPRIISWHQGSQMCLCGRNAFWPPEAIRLGSDTFLQSENFDAGHDTARVSMAQLRRGSLASHWLAESWPRSSSILAQVFAGSVMLRVAALPSGPGFRPAPSRLPPRLLAFLCTNNL